jgi:hypothetical protein
VGEGGLLVTMSICKLGFYVKVCDFQNEVV